MSEVKSNETHIGLLTRLVEQAAKTHRLERLRKPVAPGFWGRILAPFRERDVRQQALIRAAAVAYGNADLAIKEDALNSLAATCE